MFECAIPLASISSTKYSREEEQERLLSIECLLASFYIFLLALSLSLSLYLFLFLSFSVSLSLSLSSLSLSSFFLLFRSYFLCLVNSSVELAFYGDGCDPATPPAQNLTNRFALVDRSGNCSYFQKVFTKKGTSEKEERRMEEEGRSKTEESRRNVFFIWWLMMTSSLFFLPSWTTRLRLVRSVRLSLPQSINQSKVKWKFFFLRKRKSVNFFFKFLSFYNLF